MKSIAVTEVFTRCKEKMRLKQWPAAHAAGGGERSHCRSNHGREYLPYTHPSVTREIELAHSFEV
jgi:hypothetical protein